MSTNRVEANTAEVNRRLQGAYTFNAFPDDDVEGLVVVVAAIRIGDHAHLEIWTAEQVSVLQDPVLNRGRAGFLVMRWYDWIQWRDQLVTLPNYRIAEVECPTKGQMEQHVP